MSDPDHQLRELMQKSLKGDAPAYGELLSRSAHLLRHYLSERLNNKTELEDVVQEILISIHQARHTYDTSRRFVPWMLAIAKYRLKYQPAGILFRSVAVCGDTGRS